MFTGCYTVDIAFQAAKLGAFDFVQKPCSNEKLLEVLKNATEKNLIHNKSNQPHQNVTDSGTLTQMECAERDAITQTLVATNGNKLETAKRLGIGRQTLYNKIKAFEIET
jgi:DNA-binding NtrC family response regulator